jgi:hypothetical protein
VTVQVDPPKFGAVAAKAFALLQKHPAGLTMKAMRDMTGYTTGTQEHFTRRVRTIRDFYELERHKVDGQDIYILGPRKTADESGERLSVSKKLRAQLLHTAHQRCQMCGKSIKEHGVVLEIDHKIPVSWGGKTDIDNLWAICVECNHGKQDYFSSFDDTEMRAVLQFKSVHERIAQLLRMHMVKAVPAYLIEFVANATEYQDDWHKRLRELRYSVIGLSIDVSKKKINGRVQSFYTLKNWVDIPANHKRMIRDYENRNRKKLTDAE